MRSQHISQTFRIFFAHISSLTGPHILEKISTINWHACIGQKIIIIIITQQSNITDHAVMAPNAPPIVAHRTVCRPWHRASAGLQWAEPCSPCQRRLLPLPPYPAPERCPDSAAVCSYWRLGCQMTGQIARAGRAQGPAELQTNRQSSRSSTSTKPMKTVSIDVARYSTVGFNNNNNIQDNVYGAVIMAEPLREFTRFIWWM